MLSHSVKKGLLVAFNQLYLLKGRVESSAIFGGTKLVCMH